MGDRDVSGWLDGKRHGFGASRWKRDGDGEGWKNTYIGGFKKGDFWGWGKKVLSDGPKYVGGFKKKDYWGYGTIFSADGNKTCEGGFKDSGFHGYIIVTEYRDGDVIRCVDRFYRDGQVCPFPPSVVQTFPQIDLELKMEGAEYQNGITHTPHGVLTWPGGYYSGALEGGFPHGYGMVVHANNGIIQQWYEGGWDYGRASGYGEYSITTTGDRYAGGFKDGKPHGFGHVGKTVLENTMWTETFWKNGVQVG
jgi:hypothetical protein